MPFIDLYQTLDRCTGECRRDAVRKLRGIGGRGERRAAIESVFKCLAMLDVDSAIALLPEIEDEEDRMTAVVAVLKGAPSMLTPKLVKMLMELPGEFGQRARENQLPVQLRFWSELDPVAVAQFLDANPSLLSSESARVLISNWVARDPAAAEAWLAQHGDLGADDQMVEAMVHGLCQHDPAMAREYVLRNVGDERFAPMIAAVTTLSLMMSRADAAEFVRALPDATTRAAALRAASERVCVLLPAPDLKGLHDHKEVAEWLLTFPAAERGGSVENVLQMWQTVEPDQPFRWLRELPLEKQQEVFAGFSGEVNEVILRAALAVHDVRLREQVLMRFTRRPERYSPTALLALAAEFTPVEKNILAEWVRRSESEPAPASGSSR